ncbi:uncharacterized protein RHOBADRAFT_53911 [Rhodotorula graminis WP1]|uniref:Xylanolytic transcriptional activator regulatory domain-containing protein n=1 Tax=Rhodotorula graminis (strain WP1) TaxID=578459 RepID=A0A194S3C1_RHOGW|nr:uncharacterized protein RHOBADRAFT_53911 [Rhodotorula graminis WP1]KPV75000.1 hypothetical protein RHOBADRAFT_53911 [Rhodotorula graminis WP1]
MDSAPRTGDKRGPVGAGDIKVSLSQLYDGLRRAHEALKLKCDRVFPCTACRKRDCADICPIGTAKPPGRAVRIAAEFSALLRRVEQLESTIRDLGAEDRIPPPLNLEEATKRSTTVTKALQAEIAQPREDSSQDYEEQGSDGEEGAEQMAGDAAVESVLVGVGSLSIADSGRTRFLGTSAGSAYYYDENAEQDDSDHSSLADEPTALGDGITRFPYIQLGNAYPKASELERLRGYLPDEAEGRRLAENYWKYLSFQFTPLEEQVFYEDYLVAAYSPHDPHGAKLAAVFIILSLGSVFDPSAPATPNANAHQYFVLAHNTLAASRFLANSTLAGVQTLQLSANFLLNSHDFHQGAETFWPILGMASRMLVTQGLHRDGSSFGLTGVELNRRRRVFYELITLERMQAFISGRPYTLQAAHFDTQMPADADGYQRQKWRIGTLIGRVIDRAFSVATPSYSTILGLDQELRELVKETPAEWRSGALPADAFVTKPSGIPQLPPTPEPHEHEYDLVFVMRAHTLDAMFSQVLFYLHKPAFAQALLKNSDEPLKSPWAASVAAVSLETAVYLLAVAKSWTRLHPICARWWHIFFHTYACSVAQASLVIKSPRSMLAPHAWSQLNEAVAIFESAGAGGAPVASFVPRLHVLREKAYLSLQNVISVPLGLGAGRPGEDMGDALAEGTDASRFILGPPTRLERKPRKKAAVGVVSGARSSPASEGLSPEGPSPSAVLAHMLGGAPALSAQAPPVTMFPPRPSEAYHPLDSPILRRPPPQQHQQQHPLPPPPPSHQQPPTPPQQVSAQTAAAMYLSAHHHPAQQSAYSPQPQPQPQQMSYRQMPLGQPAHAHRPPSSAHAPQLPSAPQPYPPPQNHYLAGHVAQDPGQGPPNYASPPGRAEYGAAPSPLFNLVSFATDFPLQQGGAAPVVGEAGGGERRGFGSVEAGEEQQLAGMDGSQGGEHWPHWLDSLGAGSAGLPSPLDFSRFS